MHSTTSMRKGCRSARNQIDFLLGHNTRITPRIAQERYDERQIFLVCFLCLLHRHSRSSLQTYISISLCLPLYLASYGMFVPMVANMRHHMGAIHLAQSQTSDRLPCAYQQIICSTSSNRFFSLDLAPRVMRLFVTACSCFSLHSRLNDVRPFISATSWDLIYGDMLIVYSVVWNVLHDTLVRIEANVERNIRGISSQTFA